MPRKAFLADLKVATENPPLGISNITKGGEDGEIIFAYSPSSGAQPIEVTILSADVSEYPGTMNQFFISTSSLTVPDAVNNILQTHPDSSLGMTIGQLLSSLTSAFRQAYSIGTRSDPIEVDGGGDTLMVDLSDGEESDDVEVSEDDNEDTDSIDDDGYDPYGSDSDGEFGNSISKLDAKTALRINTRIRQDLRVAKLAGYKIGVIYGMTAESNSSLLSLSIRASKLGLSEDTLQAWNLKQSQYLVLLIRYAQGYKTFDYIMANGVSKDSNGLEFRVGLCNRYKPTRTEAMAAFSDAKKRVETSSFDEIAPLPVEDDSGFSSLFISSSLENFMNSKFIAMTKYRVRDNVSWDRAKLVFNRQEGSAGGEHPNHRSDGHVVNDVPEGDVPEGKVLPEIAQADHLLTETSERSFPLVSMQFFLRYFLRSPEFCLICHDKTNDTFEAIKPYVCNKGLCLFQYMQLGFGPSIEHEIITQPYVVDLLISFCYAAAKSRRIRQYPLGQFISVPPKDRTDEEKEYSTMSGRPAATTGTTQLQTSQPNRFWDIKFDLGKHEVIFDDPSVGRDVVNTNEWVVIDIPNSEPVHYLVVNTSTFPTIQLSETGITRSTHSTQVMEEVKAQRNATSTQTPVTTPPQSYVVSARFSKYDREFDLLTDTEKADSIVMLLETLPKVKEMRDYLRQESKPRLSHWTERVTQPALTLLRWIISSNRSIICQVDGVPGQTDEELHDSGVRTDDKVTGMDSWIQFRFAQGAPDKEQRFVDSLEKNRAKLNAKYPTLFAWHGSALHNWHSIIRSGLDYAETINGRAYGHGCYFAQDLQISLGYSGTGTSIQWPGSSLQMSSALAMAEIINAPNDYQSKNPYLVVQHVDWIQCRYLFVGKGNRVDTAYDPNQTASKVSSTKSIQYIEQDPSFELKNAGRHNVGIPVHAIATRKGTGTAISAASSNQSTSLEEPVKKKRKSTFSIKRKEQELPEAPAPVTGYETDETDIEDLNFMTYADEPFGSPSLNCKRKAVLDLTTPSPPATDFVPGTLDPNSIQLMVAPSYATPTASIHLSRALNTALKVEKDTPPHELGWSIDERFTDNLYQWIVELHSFDADLPLAQDMKAAGVKSVVLEIRFGKNFPISPPFVRVIRPRFLPFVHGGGGHVTAGGAMCMELLTNDGWSAVNSIESVLMQVRLAIASTDPKPARLQSTSSQIDYAVGEAMEAFVRACNTHGWQVPSDFKEMRSGAASGYHHGY